MTLKQHRARISSYRWYLYPLELFDICLLGLIINFDKFIEKNFIFFLPLMFGILILHTSLLLFVNDALSRLIPFGLTLTSLLICYGIFLEILVLVLILMYIDSSIFFAIALLTISICNKILQLIIVWYIYKDNKQFLTYFLYSGRSATIRKTKLSLQRSKLLINFRIIVFLNLFKISFFLVITEEKRQTIFRIMNVLKLVLLAITGNVLVTIETCKVYISIIVMFVGLCAYLILNTFYTMLCGLFSAYITTPVIVVNVTEIVSLVYCMFLLGNTIKYFEIK